MGCFTKGTNVPVFWIKAITDPRKFLFISGLLFVLSNAAQWLDFPGSITCLDDGFQITKPKGVHQRSWQSLHIVDSAGFEVDACAVLPDGNLLTIPEICVTYEMGRIVSHIAFNDPMGKKNLIYRITCDEQADSGYRGPVVECRQDYMMARISRTLTGFDDEVLSTPPPLSSWMIRIDNGIPKKVNVATASTHGYTLTSDQSSLMINISFNAYGMKESVFGGQKFYRGDIALIQEKFNPKITLDVKIICARGPPVCDKTNMKIMIPPSAGVLQYIDIGDTPVLLTPSSLQMHGMTLDTTYGVQLSLELNKLQTSKQSGATLYRMPSLTLTFDLEGLSLAMELSPECVKVSDSPFLAVCTTDGFMNIEVLSHLTTPNLDLNTVTLGDGTCQPKVKTNNHIIFSIPLNSCGTTIKFVGGKLFYENEIHALWKDLPPRRISRDSELRETVRCFYDGSLQASFNVNMLTQPPPVSPTNDGPLSIVLNIYPDNLYGKPYSGNQYPVVRTLRDAIFLEVQVLNRNDPNIELVLDDCWATMVPDPKTFPQWNIVVDGCQENQDNYLTVFHPVAFNVAQPTHRKRFEVKAFAFVLGAIPSTNLIYFHCSAIVCNIQSPDSPLCTKRCPMSRKRRGELFLHRHSTLASLPGPVLFVDSEPVMNFQDKEDAIEQVTIGVLPAFGLVAVVILASVLSAFKKAKC